MTCYAPLKGYRSKEVNASGRRSIVFNPRDGFVDMPIDVPCGKCIGCRLDHSRMWALRCVHEAMQYDDNCFVTLTYNDDNLPLDGSVNIEHFQDFIKKLRRKFGSGIRYFHCGEYGDKLSRPHYHVILFNFDFPDKVPDRRSVSGELLYYSDLCQQFWGYKGYCLIGSMTFRSAAYVARYTLKKFTNPDPSVVEKHYQGRRPEYVSMSRRPGIGDSYYKKYKHEMYNADFIVFDNKKHKIPRFYDNKLELEDPDRLADLKISRKIRAEERSDDNTPARLFVRQRVKQLQTRRLKRSFEND